jgi:hypothetical protein
LILLSKTLQNLANGTLPGKKEEYMQKLNEWIASNQESVHDFVDKITMPVFNDGKMNFELPPHLKANALAFLHHFIVDNYQQIREYLENNSKGTAQRLGIVLDNLGTPAKKKE